MDPPTEAAGQAAAHWPHVVAVDDDPDIRYLLSRYLGENELRVTAVATQRELDAVMSRETVDAVEWRGASFGSNWQTFWQCAARALAEVERLLKHRSPIRSLEEQKLSTAHQGRQNAPHAGQTMAARSSAVAAASLRCLSSSAVS